MRIVTLAMFVKDGKILLGMKKRGFGAGKWNGYGGKLNDGESPEQAVAREIQEESGITVPIENLNHLGTIDFFFIGKPDWDQKGMIYRIDEFEGEAIETEEMSPRWYSFDEIPYDEMWVDDKYWLPHLLANESFTAEFHFDEDGKKIAKHIVLKQ